MRSATVRLPGHPDATCDLIAEAIVDEYLKRDPASRARIGVHGGRGAIFVSGDVKSSADFDVSAVVRRTLGSLGVMTDMEPFVAIESVAPGQSARAALGATEPVLVTGYATHESVEYIPSTVALARRIAKTLDELRQSDEAWFWLGPDASVTVTAERTAPTTAYLDVEHGAKDLAEARDLIATFVRTITQDLHVFTNAAGPNDVRGLGQASGASGRTPPAYGTFLPATAAMAGLDPRHPQKGGAWLARAAARKLVADGADAAMVQLLYAPGDDQPSQIQARDARGGDLSSKLPKGSLSLDRFMREEWRLGLNLDAAKWGYAGEAGLPWETTP